MRSSWQVIVISGAISCTLVVGACGSDVPPAKFIANPGAAGASNVENVVAGPAGTVSPGAQGATILTPGLPGTGSTNAPGSINRPGSTSANNGPTGSNNGAGLGVTAGSCAGFQNATGISDSTITLSNASDLSGPVPGLFTSAQEATKAYAAYFNSVSTVCGRKLKINNLDSQTSTVGDQDAATTACSDSFAMVGSMSAFDNGGAKTVTDCAIPDLRAITVNAERTNSPVSFGTDSINVPQVSTSQYTHVRSITGDAYKKAAMLYLNAGAAIPNAMADIATMKSLGFGVVYTQPIDVTSFNYAPFVAKMQSQGVTFVQFVGAYQYGIRLKQAIDQQGLKIVYFMDSVAYDPGFPTSGGSDVNGTYAFVDTALFEEQAHNPEMQLYLKWLRLVAPSAQPSFFGLFAWGAMKLFSQLAVQLGGKLTRQSLLAGIRATHGYTANGLFAAQEVGGKRTSGCQAIIQLEQGAWVRRSPFPYTCGSVYNTA